MYVCVCARMHACMHVPHIHVLHVGIFCFQHQQSTKKRPKTPEHTGLDIGGYNNSKRKQLQEERQKEYNSMIEKVWFTYSKLLLIRSMLCSSINIVNFLPYFVVQVIVSFVFQENKV